MKRICLACGMVQTNTTDICPKCGKKTVSKGRHIVQKGLAKGGRSNG